MKIAKDLREELDFLKASLKDTDRVVGRELRPAFRAIRERLDNWSAKVAVIGQVKAGKSTFLNAFLQNHDFLPSDVNPWTSVVTNIRINLPKDPVSGASFEFFSEEDWEEIAHGDSKIRKLTERLLPGFDTELLRKQSYEMRERAERRLGSHFHALLGSQHDYDFITNDLLKRYVCAGPGSDEGLERDSLGRYAALTKVANVYMRLPQFQVPTIITDTPGVNDPFLVRDEFTCRSLDKSDVFVMVLSAHQALTDVDIALIRVLATQEAKDVLIFINRIDELDDYDNDIPRVTKDVSERLKAAIPDIEFTIASGSGYMADLVMQDSEEATAAKDALDDERLARFLRNRYGHVPEDQEDRLLLASGLNDVRNALSELIDTGTGSQQLATLLGDIRAELNGAQFVTRRERDSLQAQVDSISSEVAGDALEELTEESAGLRDLHTRVGDTVDASNTQVEKVVNKSWSKLEQTLVGAVDRFIDSQRDAFRERIMSSSVRGATDAPFEIDLSPLQEEMEVAVIDAWAKSRAGTDVALNNCLQACRSMLSENFGDEEMKIDLEDLPWETFNSTLTFARPTLKMALISRRGLAFWRRPKVDYEKSIDALRKIAAEELKPTMEKILAAYNEAQIERADAGINRVRVLLRMVEVSVTERLQRLKKDMLELEKISNDPEVRQRMVHRIQSQLEVLERRMLNLSAVDGALSRHEMAAAA